MTSETKLNHTPAPWELRQSANGYWFIDHEQGGEGYTLTKLDCGEIDARLISAAPDMLYVLQAIAADIENRARLGLDAPAWYTRARAAIDKATG